jgi:DHA2 family lincomycin resistance protein-like MFS transporter
VIEVIGIHVLLAVATSLMIGPLMTDAPSGLPAQLYSHGSAIISTIQQLMAALGTALFVTIATLATAGVAVQPDAAGPRTAFIVAGGIGVFAVICALFVPRKGISHVA